MDKVYPPNPAEEDIILAFGLDDTSQIGTPLEEILKIQTKKIKKVDLHPGYKYPAAYDDIALVELDSEVKLNEKVQTICLPKSSNSDADHLNQRFGTLVGYGPPPDESTGLNQISHKIRPQAACNSRYDPDKAEFTLRDKIRATLPDMFKDSLICGGNRFNKNHGTCPGDSGAPLLTDVVTDYETEEVRYILLAVLHGGLVPCDNSQFYAVYNRITEPRLYDWIWKKVFGKKSGRCKPEKKRVCEFHWVEIPGGKRWAEDTSRCSFEETSNCSGPQTD